MGRFVFVAAALLFVSPVAAQDPAPRQQAVGTRFGAPVLKYAAIHDQAALMFGGRGGFRLTDTFLLGFGLYGTMSEVDAEEGVVPGASGPLDVKFEAFGLDLEYARHPEAPTHLTATVFVGGAANQYAKDKTNDQEGETDFMFLLEPSLGVERIVTKWLHLNLAASYRLVAGAEQVGLSNADFAGPSLALAAKLGRF